MTEAETDHIYLHLNSDSNNLKRIGGIIISTLSAQSSFIRAVAFLLHRGFCRSWCLSLILSTKPVELTPTYSLFLARLGLRMKAMLVCFLLGLAAAHAEEFDGELQEEARFLYFNTSSTATSLTLLGAVILLGVIGYLVYVGGLLGTGSQYNRNDYYNQQYEQDYYNQAQYR